MSTRSFEEAEGQLQIQSKPSALNPKIIAISAISLVNGALYFAIAFDGGSNIRRLFNLEGNAANIPIFSVCVGASLVYTMFTYKTFESLSLKPNSILKVALSTLAPFSAAAFLTAGKEGALLLNFTESIALPIGISLFALRMINAIDASVKFPERLLETKHSLSEAWRTSDYRDLARLTVVWLTSAGYIASTTDSIYSATQTVLSWFDVAQNISSVIGYVSAGLGAFGTLPLIVYWSYRGLMQLTFGGKVGHDGQNKDPTDRYTYIALVLVTPVMLGILGGATASSGAIFGQLGLFSQVVRVSSSILYAAFAGTPGMATLLRGLAQNIPRSISLSREEERPFLEPIATSTDNESQYKVNNSGFWNKKLSQYEESDPSSSQRCSCTIL